MLDGMRQIELIGELPERPVIALVFPLIAGVNVSGQQGFVFMHFLPRVLDGQEGKFPDGQAFLPTHIAVPMLEELPAVLTGPQFQANALGIGVFGFTAFT